MKPELLAEKAKAAMESAYAPYSGFCVGAALLTKTGKIYTGCNVENAAYSATNCAERTAFFKAVSEGEREFSALAIIGGKHGEAAKFVSPCGVCRQVIREFCAEDMPVYLSDGKTVKTVTAGQLLPLAFTDDFLLEK